MQSTEKTSTSTESLHPLEVSHLQARRERVFLVMAGLFLGSLTMLNILGISRFLVLFSIDATETGRAVSWGQWASTAEGWSFALAIGVLPYPVTFLCTDLISEFYGRRRANWVVTVGFFLKRLGRVHFIHRRHYASNSSDGSADRIAPHRQRFGYRRQYF